MTLEQARRIVAVGPWWFPGRCPENLQQRKEREQRQVEYEQARRIVSAVA